MQIHQLEKDSKERLQIIFNTIFVKEFNYFHLRFIKLEAPGAQKQRAKSLIMIGLKARNLC